MGIVIHVYELCFSSELMWWTVYQSGWLHQAGMVKVLFCLHQALLHMIVMIMDCVMRLVYNIL